MGNKLKYKEVNEFVESLGYKLLSKEYIRSVEKIVFQDKIGYIYCTSFNNLKSNHKPDFINKNNPYTIKNIKLWIKLNEKPFELLSDTYNGANESLNWKCLKSECQEEFNMDWGHIFTVQKCPYCSGKKVGLSNCLVTKRPDLASQWHPLKNGKLTPYDVTVNYSKKVWWQCSKNPKHEWKISPNCRRNDNCPYCSHFYPSEDYNLLIDNPELCEEWDYDKNKKKPEEYTPHSNKEVWWKCKECGYEWEHQINGRNSKDRGGCPSCSEFKGEVNIRKWLQFKNITYICQKSFEDLIGLGGGLLSYDFYLPKYNLLIEYQGEFHDGSNGYYTRKNLKRQKEHDKRKRKYAEDNNINFLEIWYYNFNNIESILDSKINKI